MKTVESAYVDEFLKVGPVESVRLIENLLGTLVDLSGKDCWPIVDAKLAIHGSFLRTIRLKATDSISKEVEEAEWQRIMRNWPPERFSPDWCKWAREYNRVYLHSAIFDDLLEEVTRLRVDLSRMDHHGALAPNIGLPGWSRVMSIEEVLGWATDRNLGIECSTGYRVGASEPGLKRDELIRYYGPGRLMVIEPHSKNSYRVFPKNGAGESDFILVKFTPDGAAIEKD